jgi:hypothetical protein
MQPSFSLRREIETYLSKQSDRTLEGNRVLSLALVGFLALLGYNIASQTFAVWSVVVLSAGIFVVGWLLLDGQVRTNSRIAQLTETSADDCVALLERYGDPQTIVEQIESEASSALFKGDWRHGSPLFLITEHWIISLRLLPDLFAFRSSQVNHIHGASRGSPKGTPIDFFFIARIGSNDIRIPLYTRDEQLHLIRYLLRLSPGLRFDWADTYDVYFRALYREAVGEEPNR